MQRCLGKRGSRTHQIKSTPDEMVSHTGTILGPPTADQNHTVLLDVVSLAGDVRRHDLAVGQAHLGGLALARVGFLGLGDSHLQAHPLHLGTVLGGEGG